MVSDVSKLQIFNIALGFVGTRIVDNVDEKSPEAIQCNLYWDRARRSVLRDYPYDFAIRRYQPEAIAVPATYQGWSYCYRAPLNALKIWSVHTPGDYVTRQPFEVAYLDDNIIILCNVANAHITCAVDVTNLALWSEQFVTAMARKLALLISNALLKNNPQKIQELNALYEAALPEKWQEENWAVVGSSARLDIYNQALGLIGARMISSLAENVPEAVQCGLYWDRARRSVLRDYPFRFAVRRVALTARSLPSTYSGSWTHCYRCPADTLKVLSIHSETDKQTRQPFAIEYLDDSDAILCNVAGAQATYTADVEDTSRWDEKFTAAMATKLALLIVPSLVGGEASGKVRELAELYNSSIPKSLEWEAGGWATTDSPERLNICNIALGYIGANMISSTTENVPEAVQCSLYWDRARRAVLRDYPYRFSTRRVALVSQELPAVYGGEWQYCYSFPDKALKILSVHGSDKEERVPFSVEYLEHSKSILCNTLDAQATCTMDVEDIGMWDEKFTSAMSYRLAIMMCGSLIKKQNEGDQTAAHKIDELVNLYNATLPNEQWDDERWATSSEQTKLGVFNMALGYVGSRMVSSTTENTPEAVQCNLYWDRARRSVLRDFPFRFAIHREALVSTALPSSYGGDWNYCYQYPKTALRVLSVHSQGDKETRQAFAVEYKSDRTLLLCNVDNAEATFVSDVPDLSVWDEKFTNAMAHKLALMICGSVVKDQQALSSRIESLTKMYTSSLPGEILQEEQWAVPSEADRLGIYNMALGFAGCKMVSSVTENTPEAVQCSLHWDRARRSVLRDYPYDFAIRRVQLVQKDVPPVYTGQWLFCYAYPADALKILSVHGEDNHEWRDAFTVEYPDNVALILCNVPGAQATCTVDVTDIKIWDEQFVAAMSRKLALLISNALLENDQQRNQELNALYEASIPEDKWERGGWATTPESTKLNIFNMALGFIGARMVSSVSENAEEAVQCNLHFDNARRAVLRDYPFDFAIRKVALEETTMPTITRGDWLKAYLVPTDSLRVLSVFAPDDRTTRQPFTVQYRPQFQETPVVPDPPDPPDNTAPTVESFTHTLTEDETASVTGNALAGSTLGDGTAAEHSFAWGSESAQYGTITKNPDGGYGYELNNADPRVQALSEGETLTEVFSYTYTDKDGDEAQGTVTITINGADDESNKYYEWEFTIDTRLTRTDIPVDTYENVEHYEYNNPNVGMLPFTLKHSFMNGDASLDIDWGDGKQTTITKDSYTEGENDYWSASRHVYDEPGIYTIKVGSFDWDNVYYDMDHFITARVWKKNVIAINSPVPPFAGTRRNRANENNVPVYVLERSLVEFFSGCVSLESVCPSIFSRYGWGDSLRGCFQATKIRSYPSTFFKGCYNVTDVEYLFRGTPVESLPEDLFDDCSKIRTMYQAFVNCPNLKTLPKNILAPCVELVGLSYAFSGTDFPDGLKITSPNLTSLSSLNSATNFEIDDDEETATYKLIYGAIKNAKQHYEWCVWRWSQGESATFTRQDEAWRDSTINGKEIVI